MNQYAGPAPEARLHAFRDDALGDPDAPALADLLRRGDRSAAPPTAPPLARPPARKPPRHRPGRGPRARWPAPGHPAFPERRQPGKFFVQQPLEVIAVGQLFGAAPVVAAGAAGQFTAQGGHVGAVFAGDY